MQVYWCVWFNCHRHHDHTLNRNFVHSSKQHVSTWPWCQVFPCLEIRFLMGTWHLVHMCNCLRRSCQWLPPLAFHHPWRPCQHRCMSLGRDSRAENDVNRWKGRTILMVEVGDWWRCDAIHQQDNRRWMSRLIIYIVIIMFMCSCRSTYSCTNAVWFASLSQAFPLVTSRNTYLWCPFVSIKEHHPAIGSADCGRSELWTWGSTFSS